MLQILIDSVSNAYSLIYTKLEGWLHSSILLVPNLITAIIVFIVFYGLGRLAENVINKLFQKATLGTEIIKILGRVIFIAIFLAGFFFSLGILHLDKTVTSLLAGAGILGLALSFAFQDIATNFISGFMLAIRKPFKLGDLVETNGFIGNITVLSLRAIHIKTSQGQDVIIPSKDVLQKPIKNFTTYGVRKVELTVNVSSGDELDKVAEIVRDAVNTVSERDLKKDIEVYYDGFGETSVILKVMFWIDLNKHNFAKAKHDAIIAIQRGFNNHKLNIPFAVKSLDLGVKPGEKIPVVIKPKA